jgi:hypothetical protein
MMTIKKMKKRGRKFNYQGWLVFLIADYIFKVSAEAVF